MNRCLAMILGVLLLTGCTSQSQSPTHDPFANRTTFPPPATGEAAKDPYYAATAATTPPAASTNAPGITSAPAPGLSINSANATTGASNAGSIPPPSSNATSARGISLQGAGTNAATAGYRASSSNGWPTAGTGGVAEDRFPRPTADATGVSSASQNMTTQTLTPRSTDANSGQLRDISELPRNL